jgi:hypothetical protein
LPARDRYHDTVKRALAKDGWTITAEQYFIKYYGRHFWIDIVAEEPEIRQPILIEVKGFENLASPMDYLEAVLGQYLLYQAVLDDLSINIPLYLAVPSFAQQGFLSEPIGQVAIRKMAAKLLVFEPEAEEVVEWIH